MKGSDAIANLESEETRDAVPYSPPPYKVMWIHTGDRAGGLGSGVEEAVNRWAGQGYGLDSLTPVVGITGMSVWVVMRLRSRML